MRRTTLMMLAALLVLTSCGAIRDSRLNPFNWFGNSRAVATSDEDNPLIPRSRGAFARPEPVYAGISIDQVAEMAIERVPGGAVVRALGISDRQGPWDARLIARNDGAAVNGVLTYDFKVQRPPSYAQVGTEASREVTVAVRLTDQELEGVRTIRVEGTRNARESRRR